MEKDSLPLFSFRQSIFFLVIRLLFAEIIFAVLYLIVRIPKFVLFNTNISLQTLEHIHWFGIFYYVVIALIQIGVILYIVLQYVSQYYEIKPQLIVRKRGIIAHNKETYSLRNIERIAVNQGLIGRWFNFGDVELYNPSLKESYYLSGVPYPQHVAQQVENVVSRLTQMRMIPKV